MADNRSLFEFEVAKQTAGNATLTCLNDGSLTVSLPKKDNVSFTADEMNSTSGDPVAIAALVSPRLPQ